MTRLAIFDLDGTLVDSRRDLADAGNAARAALGLPPLPVAEVVPCIGDGAGKLIERLTPGHDEAARARALAAFRADYVTRLTAHTRCYPGIPELLAGLAGRGWKLAVATNKPDGFSRRILDDLGLARWIGGLRGGDGPKKPDPASLLALMREAGATPAISWMIGDHHTDLQAARNAGCRAAWCAWGFGRREGHHADVVAQAPLDLLHLLADA
jgi:phosphoglycolate phosphatase